MNKIFTGIIVVIMIIYFVSSIIGFRNSRGVDDLAYCITIGIDKRKI